MNSPNLETIEAIEESRQMMADKKAPRFQTTEELFEALDKDDE